jgi:NADPH-dependent 2,4-dienoyl-CoA reductase/sulfur reductase-like enzyme
VVDDAEKLIARTPETFKDKQNIDARVLHEVREIDLKNRRLRVKTPDAGQTTWEPFAQLLVSSGSIPIRPDVPGIDAKGIYGVNTLQSGLKVRRVVDEQRPQKAVIIGGGYIGLEMAEALIMRKLEVSLVERSEQVMNTLDPDMGELVSEALMKVGVKLYRDESLTAFETDDGSVQAVVTDQRTLPADLVILGMGVQPNTGLAQEAGIPLGAKGAIKVNDLMQTDIEGIWAAGDCAECYHLMSRQPFHIALGTVANKMGRVAGINIGGGYATFPGVVGTAVSKICDVEVARTGLQEKEVQDLGLQYVTGKIESSTRAGYYPDSGRIHVKLLAEKGTGRLLGGQIVGKEGAAKRIDVLATALHAELTLDAMINLDLSYAPPYAPVWDPVIIAARVAVKKL